MRSLVLFGILWPGITVAQCTVGGEKLAWNAQLRSVCFTGAIKRNVFASPDGRKDLIAEHSGFHVEISGATLPLPKGADNTFYPSEAAWAPDSNAFFINNGNGSGTDGWTLQVFQLRDSTVIRGPDFNALIVAAFRKALGCPATAVNPNVRGLGWSRSGSELFAFAQATVSDSCGPQGAFRGAVLNLKTGTIEHFYSEATTRRAFHNLLPFNMR